jgi:hypothetical protein
MKQSSSKIYLVWILAICVYLVLLSILLLQYLRPDVLAYLQTEIDDYANSANTFDPVATQLYTLEQNRNLWNSQQIEHYRMVVDYYGCIAEVEVWDEKVIKIRGRICHESLTVSGLFNEIEQETKNFTWFNGDGCDFKAVHPSYDPVLGYPISIERKQEAARPENIGSATYRKVRSRGEPCTLLGVFFYPTTIKSLIPLP